MANRDDNERKKKTRQAWPDSLKRPKLGTSGMQSRKTIDSTETCFLVYLTKHFQPKKLLAECITGEVAGRSRCNLFEGIIPKRVKGPNKTTALTTDKGRPPSRQYNPASLEDEAKVANQLTTNWCG
jgi:hypothetical protein